MAVRFRTQLKAEQSERLKLMNLKDDFEKKENDWNKERSEIRGQIIALTEANVRLFSINCNEYILINLTRPIGAYSMQYLSFVWSFQEKLERLNLELKNKISVLQQDLGSIKFLHYFFCSFEF